MDYQEILLSAKLLSTTERARLISALLGHSEEDYLSFRRQQFYDKQADCPRCESKQYYKYGMDKVSAKLSWMVPPERKVERFCIFYKRILCPDIAGYRYAEMLQVHRCELSMAFRNAIINYSQNFLKIFIFEK